jgi:hypothetical protein
MRKLMLSIVLLGVGFGCQAQELIAGIVAKVGNDIITDYDVRSEVSFIEASNDKKLNLSEVYHDILKLLVVRNLQEDYLVKANGEAKVPQTQIDNYIEHYGKDDDSGLAGIYAKFAQAGVSKKQLQDHVIGDIRVHQAQMLYVQQHRADILLSEDEVARGIADFRGQHSKYCVQDYWLSVDNDKYLPEFEKWKNNASVLPLEVSKRDVVCKLLADWPDSYAQELNVLGEGELSSVIKVANGSHILKVVKLESIGDDLSGDEIQNILQEQQSLAAIRKWVDELASSQFVKLYVGPAVKKA